MVTIHTYGITTTTVGIVGVRQHTGGFTQITDALERLCYPNTHNRFFYHIVTTECSVLSVATEWLVIRGQS